MSLASDLDDPASRRGAIAATLALSLLGLAFVIVGPRHEPWFDEAQAWLIARDADPWTIIRHYGRYEGTPTLWHLVLWGFQRLGGGYAYFWVVSCVFAIGGAWLILFRSPFPYGLRCGFVFSYFSAYQFSIVARSYCLDLFLFPALAALFPSRVQRPMIYGLALGALANANAHSFVIAAPLALEFAIALIWNPAARTFTVPRPGGPLVFAVLALCAVYQAWPPADPLFASCCGGVMIAPLRPLALLTIAFFDPGPKAPAYLAAIAAVAIVFVLTPSVVLCRRAGRGWLALGLFGAIGGFMVMVTANYWHAGFFFLITLFLLWISWPAVAGLERTLRIWLFVALGGTVLVSAAGAAASWARDVSKPYSAGRQAAAYLASMPANATVAADGFKTFAIQPYFSPSPIGNAGPHARGAIFEWRRDFGVPYAATLANWSALAASRRYDVLVLSPALGRGLQPVSPFIAIAQRNGYRLVRRFDGHEIWMGRELEDDTLLIFERPRPRASGGQNQPASRRGLA